MEELVVSIVIPVYNVQKYLRRCIESIRKQSYTNLDIILIDDGSTDSSGKLCDEYANMDMRINVIHQSNKGVAEARNTGLKHVKGKYCCFFDADDSIDVNTIQKAVSTIEMYNADVVMFGHDEILADGKTRTYIPDVCKTVFEGEEIYSFLLPEMIYSKKGTKNLWLSCSTNLYNTRVINIGNFRFHDVHEIYSEDAFATLELFKSVNKVVIIQRCFYHYYQNNESQSHSLNFERYVAIGDFYVRAQKIYADTKYNELIRSRLPGGVLNSLLGAFKIIAKSKNENKHIFIRRLIDNSHIQEAIQMVEIKGENIKRGIMIKAIIKRKYLLCYILSYLAR